MREIFWWGVSWYMRRNEVDPVKLQHKQYGHNPSERIIVVVRRKDNLLFYINQIARKQQSPYLIITKHVKVNVKNGLQAPDSVNKRVTMDA